MLMQELGRIIQEDPNLCAMAMVDKRKYIISKWNASHSEPIDEDAVALFLCDENRGNLTDEQRAFAKERCAEFEFCNQMTLVDSQNLLKEEISLASFTAGFKLAWGLSKELEADGLYSFDEEETERVCRRMEQEE